VIRGWSYRSHCTSMRYAACYCMFTTVRCGFTILRRHVVCGGKQGTPFLSSLAPKFGTSHGGGLLIMCVAWRSLFARRGMSSLDVLARVMSRRYGKNFVLSRQSLVKFELNGKVYTSQPQRTRSKTAKEVMCYIPVMRSQGQAKVSVTCNGVDWTNSLVYGVWNKAKDR